MRKFFLVVSILVLIILLSVGIYHKLEDSRGETSKNKELSLIYKSPVT